MKGRGRAHPYRLIGLIAVAGGLALSTAAWAQAPWVAPPAERARKNPQPAAAATIELGEKLARANCLPCHGASFTGNGPAATALNPKPADWTSTRVQGQPDGDLFWKISNGRGAMPPWKHLGEKDRWALIRFIRSLKK